MRSIGFHNFKKNTEVESYSTGGGFYDQMKESYFEDVSGGNDCKRHLICGKNNSYKDEV